MKFSLFSDFHHYPGVFPNAEEKELNFILDRAVKCNVDFIIQAGDICHGNYEYADFVKKYTDFSEIPTYSCLGNHDLDKRSLSDALKLFKMPSNYYYFDCKGYRIVVYDPNYCNVDGEYIHYDMGNHQKYRFERTWINPEQIEWLRKTIDESPYPCILIGHASFIRNDGIKNAEECLKVFREANKKRPHSVLMIINGHHHCNEIHFLDGICHFDINSSSFYWISKAHSMYPADLCEKIVCFKNTIAWDVPIHAIVTVEGTTITIEGMDGKYLFGVTPEMLGDDPIYIEDKKHTDSNVLSAKFTLL